MQSSGGHGQPLIQLPPPVKRPDGMGQSVSGAANFPGLSMHIILCLTLPLDFPLPVCPWIPVSPVSSLQGGNHHSLTRIMNPVAVWLKLPPSMKIHPTFHVSQLKLVQESPLALPSVPPHHPGWWTIGPPTLSITCWMSVNEVEGSSSWSTGRGLGQRSTAELSYSPPACVSPFLVLFLYW